MVRTSSRSRLIAVVLTCASLAMGGMTALGVVTATAASASDNSMFDQVNSSRAAAGKSAYSWNSHLAEVASEQAHRMASKHTLYHNPNLASDVGNYRWVGENVGYGPSSDVIESAFMKSPHHKANILDSDYTQIGIASVRDSGGRLWVAQVFREPLSSGSSDSSSSSSSNARKRTSSSTTAKARTTPKRTKSVTHREDATSDATPTADPTPTTKPERKPARKPVATPAPEPTLEQRVSYATSQTPDADADPLSDALAFAETMNAIGG